MSHPGGPLEYRLRSHNGAATGIKIISRAAASAWLSDRRAAYPTMEWLCEYRMSPEGPWRIIVEGES